VARDRRVEGVAPQVELAGEKGVDDPGVTEAPPVGVDDGVGRGLGGERAVAEERVEEPALLGAAG